jgi:hypothetical protein
MRLLCVARSLSSEMKKRERERERERETERERQRESVQRTLGMWETAYEELSELTLCRLPSLESREVCRTSRPAAATAPPGPPWCITTCAA